MSTLSNNNQDHSSIGLHDERRSIDGAWLPGWKRINDTLDKLNPDQIQRRQLDIARQLRANGIAYSALSENNAAPRPWHLDLYPFLVESSDWATLSQGLVQRARLKQAIFNNIYGNQSLLRDGHIPPAMVYAHRGYLRNAVNVNETTELPVFSADVSRSPSGQWYVVDDICQFQEGIGYSLENRLVLSRVLPGVFREARVRRIASYFKILQNYIQTLTDSHSRCVLLAPGPEHPHYFEYAFLAKYLGYTLVQPGDLTIRDERAFLKTVAGLKRVYVILRFTNDIELDPMTDGQTDAQGVTGLFQAVRTGGVKVINPLGAGALDNPALNTCLPDLCQLLLGEELLLRSAPTYWLGNQQQQAHVMEHFDNLLFRDIDSLGQLFDPQLMSDSEKQTLRSSINKLPEKYVAQERIDRSTAPSFQDAHQVERQITLRMFLIRDASNEDQPYMAMPGGLCLLDTAKGGRRPAFDSLIGSKDTWVIADGPEKPITLLGQQDESDFSVLDGELPSRVAENLFWLGRNAQRSENVVRLLRAVFKAMQSEDNDIPLDTEVIRALLRTTSLATSTLPGFVGRGAAKRLLNPQRELKSLLNDATRIGTLPNSVKQLLNSAASVRDRVSDELLNVFNRLDDRNSLLIDELNEPLSLEDTDQLERISDQLDEMLMTISAFTGLMHENFTHSDGWRFMMLGLKLERVSHTATIINSMLKENPSDTQTLEHLLKVFDSTMTYRSRYRSQIKVRPVLQLLLADELNPRSLAFQLREIEQMLSFLPGRQNLYQADTLSKLAMAGLSRVRLADINALLQSGRHSRQTLPKFLNVLASLPNDMADVLNSSYFTHVESRKQLNDVSKQSSELYTNIDESLK
jgi:uncharacterized circularly permuted ATP-grasp superfamily protein/uncharacterized alpha-E superfamily protein